jgi:hypothetical protein
MFAACFHKTKASVVKNTGSTSAKAWLTQLKA